MLGSGPLSGYTPDGVWGGRWVCGDLAKQRLGLGMAKMFRRLNKGLGIRAAVLIGHTEETHMAWIRQSYRSAAYEGGLKKVPHFTARHSFPVRPEPVEG